MLIAGPVVLRQHVAAVDDHKRGPVVAFGEEGLDGLVEQLRVHVVREGLVREHVAHGPGGGLGVGERAHDFARREVHAIGVGREDDAALVAEMPRTGRNPVLRDGDDALVLVDIEDKASALVVAYLVHAVQHAAVERLGAVALRHPDSRAVSLGGAAEQVVEGWAVGDSRCSRGIGGGCGSGIGLGAGKGGQGNEHDRTDNCDPSHATSPIVPEVPRRDADGDQVAPSPGMELMIGRNHHTGNIPPGVAATQGSAWQYRTLAPRRSTRPRILAEPCR